MPLSSYLTGTETPCEYASPESMGRSLRGHPHCQGNLSRHNPRQASQERQVDGAVQATAWNQNRAYLCIVVTQRSPPTYPTEIKFALVSPLAALSGKSAMLNTQYFSLASESDAQCLCFPLRIDGGIFPLLIAKKLIAGNVPLDEAVHLFI